MAAAVILDPGRPIDGLADSKRLSERRRESLFDQIVADALDWSVGRAEVAEIDSLNILHASLLAMQRAVNGLRRFPPSMALVDGNRLPPALPCAGRAIVGGDATEPSISAASIIAKVTRDREMVALDAHFPGYGLARHKGYPTRQHIEALQRLGVCPIHRRSFAPVRLLCGAKD